MYARETIQLVTASPDLIPQDAPREAWNVAQNVLFRNNEAARWPGDVPALNTTRHILAAVFLVADGTSYWAYSTTAGIFVHDGTTETDITPAAGWTGADQIHTACVLGGIAYFNAPDRDPVLWNGNPTNICTPLPGWPAGGRCLALRAHKAFLFALGMISEHPALVRWSDAAEPGAAPSTWAPAADNLAGDAYLPPGSSAVLDAVTIRDDLLIFKGESIWLATFTTDTNVVFVLRKAFNDHGIIGTGAWCAGPNDEILFMGAEGDGFVTDGVNMRSALDGRAQRTVQNQLSVESLRRFSGAFLAREKLGILAYPQAGQEAATIGVVFDFASGALGFREFDDVYCMADGRRIDDAAPAQEDWDSDTQAWDDDQEQWQAQVRTESIDDVFTGHVDGLRHISSPQATDYVEGPVSAYLEKSGISFGNAQRRKMIARLWPKVIGTPGDVLTFRAGGQEITGGPITLSGPLTYVVGQEEPLDCFVQGRFMAMIVESDGGNPWRLGSIDVEYRGVGKW